MATPEQVRNRGWEREFYAHIAEEVSRRSGLEATPLLELTERRMDMGAAQYGDNAFLTDERDLIQELRDEYADGIAYVVMELQKRQLDPKYDNAEYVALMHESAIHACIADAFAREARRAALGLGG